jgi:hypothetical protein
VNILQQGMAAAFNALAERAKDQLEDIGAAGGIFSAGQFSNIPGFPKTFQGAMDLQDKINKDMATIASNLPGTTHDYVENSRRLVDTTAQIMARDMKGFTSLATELTGKMNISAEEAFRVVNVEVAKATTMLEKLNPARTVVPMTQLVEDMLKDEKVTIGGLRRYVSFRRSTTFEAALQRNIDELNKTGAGTADRLKMIIKVLKQAAPPEMVNAFQASVAGVVEGFRSAVMDPDVGLFGLSRALSFEVKKFDRETGKQIGSEFTNFFKMFSEVFGNIGNLINTAILPGLQALYQPFDSIAKQFVRLREVSYKIFQRQQEYSKYFDELAAKYGMRREDFKVFEKGGISVMMDVLQGFGMLSDAKYKKYVGKMEAKGTPEQIAKNMKEIYADLIPTIFESPFFKEIGKTLGNALASVFKEIAKLMKALLTGNYGTNEFLKAFYDSGGMDAVNEILMYVAEGIGKVLMKIVEVYMGALTKAIGSGNFAAAGVLGALGLVFGAPAVAGIKIIASGMKLLVNAFKFLITNAPKLMPIKAVKVRDVGSTITDPRRMLPAAKSTKALPGSNLAAGAVGGMNAFTKFMEYFKGVGPRFLSFFKGILGKLAIFGAAITTIVSLFQGKDLARSLAEGAGPLLGAALGAALIPFLGPIGPAIGSIIGGWVGSLRPVVDTLTGVFSAIGWGLSNAWATVQPILDSLWGSLTTLGEMFWNVTWGLIPGIEGLTANFDFLNFAFVAIKVALFPFISTLNGVAFALQGLQLGLLAIDKWINATFQWGDRQGRIQAQMDKVVANLEKTAARQAALNTGLLQPLPPTPGKPSPKTGTPAPTPSPVFAPPPAAIPQTGPAVEAAKTTAVQAQGINTKAATQITHAVATRSSVAATQKSSEETKKNTATANTTLGNIRAGIIAISNKVGALQSAMLGDLNNIQAGVKSISSMLASGKIKVQADFGMPGGLPGGGAGGPAIFGSAAQKFGLQMTSGYRPGDPGYHGINRARDYSNGSGPTPQMMQFAQYLYTTFGRNLKELIYTPLGFSIKNGRKVPPYAQAAHYNHVHVAWAYGPQNPVAFGSQTAAQSWERSMIPGSMKVASVTANSGEGLGGGTTINGGIHVSVNGSGVNDADALASLVALKIGEAVADARAASIFV